MARDDEIYVLPDDEVLDPFRRRVERSMKLDGPARRSERSGVQTLAPPLAAAAASNAGVIPLAARPSAVAASLGETERPATGLSSGVTARPKMHGGYRPLVASTLSIVFWGTGQMINRQAELGAMMLLTQAFVAAAHWFLVQTWSSIAEVAAIFEISELRLALMVAALDYLLVFFVLWGVHQAYRRADFVSAPFEGIHLPALSGAASLILPGLGQLVNAQPVKAVVFLFGQMTGGYVVALMMLSPLPAMIASGDPDGALLRETSSLATYALAGAGVLWILAVYDAVLVAAYRRRAA